MLRREGEARRSAGQRRRAEDAAGTSQVRPDRAGPRAARPGGRARLGLARHAARRETVAAAALRDTAEHPRVFALRGRDPGTLASQLDVIAASAAVLSDAGFAGLARRLAVSAAQAKRSSGELPGAP